MEIGTIEKGEKLDRDIKYKDIVIGNVSEVLNLGAVITIYKYDLVIDSKKFIIEITKIADKLISIGFRKIILNYGIHHDDPLINYLKDQFIENGNHLMIARGWVPGVSNSNPISRSFIIEMITRRRTGSTNFQDIMDRYKDNKEPNYSSQLLFNISTWIKYSPYQIKIINEQNPDSYVSNVLGIAYPISKRPPTSMSAIARSLGSIKTIKLNQPNTTGRPIAMEMIRDGKKKLEHLIPVTRYSYSVEKGGYFSSDKKQEYCGTFYYWEPSSNIYLIMGKSAYFPNKIAALLSLEPKNEILLELIENFIILSERNGFVDKDLEYDVKEKEMIKLLTADDILNSSIYGFDNFFNSKDNKYEGNIFYAMEDDLDQSLCIAGKKAGLDIIIFSRMPSSRRIVTELLDTRDRQDSLNNLVWELQ